MTQGLQSYDYIVFTLYFLIIASYGFWIYKRKQLATANSTDFFLAEGQLTWWAIGASLIASNISAEQFIGMSGSGFAIGLAIASYEFMAALTLLIVGKYFLPIFIKTGIYTIPEFLEKRYNSNVKSVLAVFWIFLFIFVNLTTVLYLGGTALDTIMGNGDGSLVLNSIIGLGLFAAAYSLWGGLSSVAWTDVIQVVFLVLGGLATTYLALNTVSGGEGIIAGFSKIENEIQNLDKNLTRSLANLSFINGDYIQRFGEEIGTELKEIKSSIRFNNLIQVIDLYRSN